ncbi:MAG: hypothetical protein IMX00_08925 [Limnochordales bacterium]|nr:hypothetical protein [Limnochordales bacterium]
MSSTHSDHFYPAELEMRRPPFGHPALGETDLGLDIFGNAEVLTFRERAVVQGQPADPFTVAYDGMRPTI